MRVAACFGLLLTLMSATTSAAAPALTRVAIAEFFDTALTVQEQDYPIAGAVIGVVHDGEILYLGGYGWADIEAQVPADPRRSLFRIASISKPFIWTALMQLVERGELSLDDPVQRYLDFEIPATFDAPILIRHLMSHTPGFEERGTGTAARTLAEVPSLRDYLVTRMPARVRPPGQQASYSNYGTALAGYVIEQVSGMSWGDYLDRHVLAPLAMPSTNTQADLREDLAPQLARSYRFADGRFEATDYLHISDGPAGLMSATAEDMTRFMLAHLGDGSGTDGRVLGAAGVRQMRGVLFQPHPAIEPILHGFIRANRNGQVIYGHGGDVNGFHSQMSLFPELGLGLFVAFNSDPAAAARGALVDAFVDRFFPAPHLRPAPEPATLQIGQYTGEYLPLRRNQSTFERLAVLTERLSVAVDGDQLLLSGNRVSRWVPIGNDAFTGLYEERQIAFRQDADEDGLYAYLGSALASYERVRGLNAPSVLRALFGTVAVIFALAVLGWGYRAVRPAEPVASLPRIHVAIAWLHAAATLYLVAQLALTLAGDVEEFQFGVPADVHRNLMLMSGNLVLGALVVAFALLQWPFGYGSPGSRLRYDVVAVTALINAWLAYYFNYASYAARLLP